MTPICLIGEADAFVAHLLQRFAEQNGLAVVRAPVAQELVELARQLKPAVIILEPELPGKVRGWEAAQALQADASTRAIPLVGCSWLTEADARTLVAQLCGYLHKPDLSYEDFVAALHGAGVIAEPGRESVPIVREPVLLVPESVPVRRDRGTQVD